MQLRSLVLLGLVLALVFVLAFAGCSGNSNVSAEEASAPPPPGGTAGGMPEGASGAPSTGAAPDVNTGAPSSGAPSAPAGDAEDGE